MRKQKKDIKKFIKKNLSTCVLATWAVVTLLCMAISSGVQKYLPALYSETFMSIMGNILLFAMFGTCIFVYYWDCARHLFNDKED